MCGKCKKAKHAKRKKTGVFSSLSKVPKRYEPKARKRPPTCIKCSKANNGKYIKGGRTRKKAHFKQKMVGARRGHKRGAQWIDDDYLANMPVKGGQKKFKSKQNFTFLG